MSRSENPCLSLAIAHLTKAGADNFAIWVVKAPYPGGYVIHDCVWPQTLTQTWFAWQQMFKGQGPLHVPLADHATLPPLKLPPETGMGFVGQTTYGGRLMQDLGICLWQWLFDGPIENALASSQGIAMGQKNPLRLRLEIRDPDLIALPWEIMQPQPGKQAISLSQQILFSRTTSYVDPLPPQRLASGLNILLVLGQDAGDPERSSGSLQLEQEASTLASILERSGQADASSHYSSSTVLGQVDALVQPTRSELIKRLETGDYNILFYAGHGVPGPDGGLLFLRPDATINGTELAQVLVSRRVTLCVVNACWGAQPDQRNQRSLERSSLAEVLIHHGVPAVLAMRDSIADQEAISFIQAFAQALAARQPIDQAVALARQQLLMVYKFNKPAWTLPVLYMHPQFDGGLIASEDGITQMPIGVPLSGERYTPTASLRSLGTTEKVWQIKGARMRVGRSQENDVVLEEPGVSRKHAEIFRRDSNADHPTKPTYILRDDSSFGTLISGPNGWQKVHHEEVALQSGVQLKFGNPQGQTLEFIIER